MLGIDRTGRELRILEALEQLTLLIEHQGLERQCGFAIEVKLESVAMLVTRNDGKRHRRTAGDTRVTDLTEFVPFGKCLGVQTLTVPRLRLAHLSRQLIGGALHLSIDQ